MASDENLSKCNFEEINRARYDPNALVIDVREIEELREMGYIPGAINIPLGDVSVVLGPATSHEEFKAKLSRDKPNENCPIIFTCRSGRRSAVAHQEALRLGYKNAKSYAGGWLDWERQIKKH